MPGKASLAEMMGSKASGPQGLNLSNLHEVLGSAMPELPRNAIGRHRLIMALRQRFGDNFRSLPGVSGIIREFDGDIEFETKAAKLRQIKFSPTERREKD